MSLLTLSTKSLAQATLLLKSSPAPFDGVLMTIDYAKDLQIDHMNASLYKMELKKHEGEVPLYAPSNAGTYILIGVGSFLVGFLIGLASR
jgi:hypothetical protein